MAPNFSEHPRRAEPDPQEEVQRQWKWNQLLIIQEGRRPIYVLLQVPSLLPLLAVLGPQTHFPITPVRDHLHQTLSL